MLQLRPNCECCGRDLPPESRDALICSFECTWCVDCARSRLPGGLCPNCAATWCRARPPAEKLGKFPPSTERIHRPNAAAAPSRPDRGVPERIRLAALVANGFLCIAFAILAWRGWRPNRRHHPVLRRDRRGGRLQLVCHPQGGARADRGIAAPRRAAATLRGARIARHRSKDQPHDRTPPHLLGLPLRGGDRLFPRLVAGDDIWVSGTTGYDYARMTIAPSVVTQCDQAFRNNRRRAGRGRRDAGRRGAGAVHRARPRRLGPAAGGE